MQLKELGDYLEGKGFEDFGDYDLFEEQVKENRLFLENMAIHIPEYNIKIREGICESWDTKSEEYEPDHTFYMIFDMHTDEYLYKESGSGINTTLHNFLHFNNQQNLTEDELLELQCEVHFI